MQKQRLGGILAGLVLALFIAVASVVGHGLAASVTAEQAIACTGAGSGGGC